MAKERRGAEKVSQDEIGFDEEMYLPRSVFMAMLDAGTAHVEARLSELGVVDAEKEPA